MHEQRMLVLPCQLVQGSRRPSIPDQVNRARGRLNFVAYLNLTHRTNILDAVLIVGRHNIEDFRPISAQLMLRASMSTSQAIDSESSLTYVQHGVKENVDAMLLRSYHGM